WRIAVRRFGRERIEFQQFVDRRGQSVGALRSLSMGLSWRGLLRQRRLRRRLRKQRRRGRECDDQNSGDDRRRSMKTHSTLSLTSFALAAAVAAGGLYRRTRFWRWSRRPRCRRRSIPVREIRAGE